MAISPPKKVFLVLGVTCLFVMLSILGTGIYLYYHPEQIKPILERSLSAYSGSICTIESLSYSFQPMSIEAKNILFKPLKQQKTFSMEIRSVKANMAVKGPFGQRSLFLENIQINGFNLHLFSGPFTLPKITRPGKGKSSFLYHLYRRIFSFILFRKIRFRSGEILDGRISSINGAQTIQAENVQVKVGAGKPLSLSFALKIDSPSQKIQFIAPIVNIHTDGVFNLVDRKLNGTLQSRSMTLQSPEMKIRRLDVFLRFAYTYPYKKLSAENLQVSGDTIAINTDRAKLDLFPVSVSGAKTIKLETKLATYDMDKGEIESAILKINIRDLLFKEKAYQLLSPLDLQFKAKARLKLHPYQVNLEGFHLVFSDIINMEGNFLAMPGHKELVRLKIANASISSKKGFYFLPAEVKESLKSFKLEGLVSIQGDLLGKKEVNKWFWECNLISRLKNNPFAFLPKEAQFKGLASAVIKAKGRFPDVIISAEIQGDNNILSTRTLTLEPFKMVLFLSMRYPLIDIKDVTVHIPQGKIDLNSRNILMRDIRINIPKGRLDIEKRSIAILDSKFDASNLKNILINGNLEENKITLSVKGRETHFLQLADSYRLLPAGWLFKAHDSIQIKVEEKEKGIWNLQSTLSFEKLAFQNKSESKLGENISFNIDIDGILDLKHSKLTLAASLKAQEGEALFDRYYLNLKRNSLITSVKASYHVQKRYLQLSKLNFRLTDILPLEIQGRFSQNPSMGHTDFTVSIPPVSLKPIFQHFFREPYKTERPFLATLETEGTVSAKFRINEIRNSWQVAGRIGWQEGKLILKEKNISLKGIYLDLPVWYRTPFSSAPLENLKGRLAVQSLMVPLLPEQTLNIALDISPNRIFVESPTEIKTPGGDLNIGPVQIEELFGPELSIHTSLSFDGIKLRPFLSKIWRHPLAGSLSGILDPVRYKGHAITSHGQVTAMVFGGKVLFSRLGASGIFTSAPIFKLDAQVENLLLSDMTTDTSFGKIEGIIEGYIRDLEIAYGQPQKFNLLLETIKKNGVSQRISVKAIDNIAQIGGGLSPFMGLAGTFASFFKKFPYEKIGIRASLENDLFTINGTIKESGTEYLVKRGRFSGVNVVNQNPNNRISFKDMVKRIKRISKKEGPIVK